MSPAPPIPAELLATAPEIARRVAVLLAGLAALIARAFLRDPRHVAIINPLWARITNAARRFTRLMDRVAAGTLASRPRASCAGTKGGPSPAKLPRQHAWLLAALRHEGAYFRNHLERMFWEPQTAALLAQLPQAARILRPICDMLGLRDPCVPQLPRRKRQAAPTPPSRPEKPAKAPRDHAPSVFLPRPPQELCPRLLTRWPWVPHPNAKPKAT